MLFSSMIFLWIFLPVVLALSRLVPDKYCNILLLISSLIFYAWGEPKYILLMLLSIFVNWAAGLIMESRNQYKRLVLLVTVICNLLILGYYKYYGFFAGTVDEVTGTTALPMKSIVLPIGISFFTFQAMSYVIDLYRGEYRAEHNILNVALYISFFPQLIAGPIVKYKDIHTQIKERHMSWEQTADGARRFVYGLGKKVIIANTLAVSVDRIYSIEMVNVTGLMAWCAAVFYMLQIYYDFSGYSDMAIGLGKMFGFEFQENFKYPYMSTSIREFWRRWHISLGSWFKEYLYIPLGGSRKGEKRTCLNLLLVFAVTGLWHGAGFGFVLWGLYHGVLQLIERMGWRKVIDRIRPLGWVYTTLAVMLGWILFRVENVVNSIKYAKRIFLPWNYTSSIYSIWEMISVRAIAAAVIGITGMGIIQMVIKKVFPDAEKLKCSYLEMIFSIAVYAFSVLMLAGNTYNPFIYFRF